MKSNGKCRMIRNPSAMAAIVLLAVGSAVGAQPLRALILSGRNNHDWKQTTPELVKLYQDSPRFIADVTEDPTTCTADVLANYDVLVSNWCAWPDVNGRQWGPQVEKAFLDFVRSGKGVVLVHAASATFHNWPEYQQIAGATWKLGSTGHGPMHLFKVTVKDKTHPVTAGLADFEVRDELWHRMGKQPDIHVLCEAFSAKDKGGSGQIEPVVICTEFGKGRCFYNILGHDATTMQNAAWRTLMLRGTEWAATGKVTIPVPDELATASNQAQAGYRWQQTKTSLTLLKDDKIVWRHNHDKGKGKPFFDHPQNRRHPSPWYVSVDAKVPFGYFSPAVLFNEPYTLRAGKSLTLKYRVLIHPGQMRRDSLETEARSFGSIQDEQSR